jgi:hypothetical protein
LAGDKITALGKDRLAELHPTSRSQGERRHHGETFRWRAVRHPCRSTARPTLAITLRGLVQVSGLIAEIRVEPAHMVRRSSDWAREQIADPALQNLVGR